MTLLTKLVNFNEMHQQMSFIPPLPSALSLSSLSLPRFLPLNVCAHACVTSQRLGNRAHCRHNASTYFDAATATSGTIVANATTAMGVAVVYMKWAINHMPDHCSVVVVVGVKNV
jgi:hypothetical protein